MWRSLLFFPVLEERFVAGAAGRGASAVVLDLEAGVAEARRPEARAALPGAVERLSPEVEVAVRVNPLWLDAVRDLDACVVEGVASLHLARCETPMDIVAVDRLVSELEAERGLPPGAVSLVGMLESPGAVLRAAEIAGASGRMAGLTLGVEDYATAMGRPATGALLAPAGVQVIQAARSAGLEPLVVPASISDFRNLGALEEAAVLARSLGSTGGYAVHPGQVDVLNRVFAPTGEELDWARRVLDAAGRAEAAGRGVFQVDGRMVDRPLVTRARDILRDAEGQGRGGPETGG